MARNDDDLGVLSPFQQTIENANLSRVYVPTAPLVAPASNPLLSSPSDDSSLQPVTAAPSASSQATSNPLVQPPFPVATMGTDQRLRWQEISQQAQQRQDAINKAAIDAEISRREEAHKAEIIQQTKGMIDRSAELDPSDLEGYPLARIKLARDFPLAAGTPEVQRGLAPLDDLHKQASGYETWYKKEAEKLSSTQGQDRLKDAKKTAADLGPDYLARFSQTQKDKGVEAAIDEVNATSGKAKQDDLIAQLKNSGLTEQQIQERYGGGTTGQPFRFGAAEFEAKQKVDPKADHNRAVATFLQLQKQRDLDGLDPAKWTDLHEKAYQDSLIDVDQTGARVFNRAGVQGFDPVKAKAEKAEQDRKDKEAKDREAQAKAAQTGYWGNLGNAILGNQPVVPLATVTPPVAPPITTPTPTPAGGYPACQRFHSGSQTSHPLQPCRQQPTAGRWFIRTGGGRTSNV